jgi:putative tryptophan/tyrosine transport system substrate-binding protein
MSRLSRRQVLQGAGVAGLGLLAGCGRLATQAPGRIPRVGILEGALPMSAPQVQAFVQGLRDLGYQDGQNLSLEFRSAETQNERLPALATELVRLGVDIIVAGGAISIRAALQATDTIPIVMLASNDPVSAGFVTSLARPGGNATGLAYLSAPLAPKRLELLKETVPHVTRIAVIGSSVAGAVALSAVGSVEFEQYKDAARLLRGRLKRE